MITNYYDRIAIYNTMQVERIIITDNIRSLITLLGHSLNLA